jgi:hypothetical protein
VKADISQTTALIHIQALQSRSGRGEGCRDHATVTEGDTGYVEECKRGRRGYRHHHIEGSKLEDVCV